MHKVKVDDRRRLILARRMVTRTRAGAACAPCKAKKARCNDYRPCARCSNLRLEACCQARDFHPRPNFPSYKRPNFRTGGSKKTDLVELTITDLMAQDRRTSQSWMQSASPPNSWFIRQTPIAAAHVPDFWSPQFADCGSTCAFTQYPHQVPLPLLIKVIKL